MKWYNPFTWFKKRKPKTEYRERGEKKAPRVFHPLAKFKEDLGMLNAKYGFKFDKNHFFILHYTAGRVERKSRDFIKSFLKRGLCTYFIDGNGIIWQQFDGDRCGAHVGKNRWNGKNIGRKCAGVEVANSGRLEVKNDKFVTWYGEEILSGQVREITREQVASGDYSTRGFFRKYEPQQEQAIAELMAWHIALGLPKENLLGHDIVAYPRGRKSDHSGSLSKPLKKFIEEDVLPLVDKYKQS